MYRRWGKRLLDLIIALPAAILLSPMLGIVAMLVRAKLGTPILFRQTRPGLDGQPFSVYKFRTMTDTRDAVGRLLPDAERLTRVGRFLRSTSLDELPELLNVVKGEMSLVGPRPLLIQYLERYTPRQRRRLEVKPGLTGWAQIHGRNSATWDKRFEQDVWYVNHCSLATDLRIILVTPFVLMRGDGGLDTAWQLGEYMGPESEPNRDGRISDQ
jgi:sugar transferase EpsL